MATQQQFITDLYSGNQANEGIIKYYKEHNNNVSSVVCVKRWRTFEWVRLNDLSSSLWMRYRNNISHYLPHLNTVEEEKTDNKLVASLLTTLTMEQRKKWLAENNEYKDKICVECGLFDPEKKKCIHHDCPGMCATCFDIKNKSGFENCACCGKKQEMTCPVCRDDFATDNLVKSEQCAHRICWSCFGRSVKSSRPLSHCPLCRGVFCEKLIDIEDYDLDDIPALDEDDDMPALDEDDNMPPLVEIDDRSERFAIVRAQEGIDLDAIMAAIANNRVTVRDDGLVV